MRFRWLSTLLAAYLLLAFLPGHPAGAATASGRIAGVVRDQNGTPQGDANVVLVDGSGTTAGTDTTGSDGRYSIAVAPGQYDLAVVTAAPPNPRIARVRAVDVAADSELDVVVLPPYATLSGTVRDASGTPLPGAGVQLGGRRTNAGPDGRYSLLAHPGRYRLSVGWGPGTAGIEGFTLTGDRTQDLTFAVTDLIIDARSPRGEPLAVAASHVYSPNECGGDCPAGFELFPGSGEARGSWRACCQRSPVPVLPGDLVVTVTPADPTFAQVTALPVRAPWTNPLRVVMPDAPPPVQQPAKVTWNGVVRHNGVPVPGAELNVGNSDWGDYDEDETDSQGRFELRITPGNQGLSMYAPIGASSTDEDGGTTPGLYLTADNFEVASARTLDINIQTEDFAVTVLDAGGHPAAQIGTYGPSFTRSLEIFPGAMATATVQNSQVTDASGHATFLKFPETLPTQIGAGGDGNYGWTDVPAGARTATVRLTHTPEVTLSGIVRDARGPLPLVNQPWVSFAGQADPGDYFNGSFIGSTGGYALTTLAGHQNLIISDLPEHEGLSTGHLVATPTLPEEWTITTEIDVPTSKTLDLTIPDAGPAHFRAADTNGNPQPAHFQMSSTHRVNLGSGLTGTADAHTLNHGTPGPFQHMMFGPAKVNGAIVFGTDTAHERSYGVSLQAAPGDHFVLAFSSDYDGGDLMPSVPSTTNTTSPPTTTTTPAPAANPGASTAANPTPSGYWALASDGNVYAFGDAAQLGNTAAGAVDLEPTPSGKGYWTLNKDGKVAAFGDAARLGDVDLSQLVKGETPASLSATSSGKGYWVFTNRGRAIAFGDAPHLGDMSGTKLNGPVLGSVATPTGKGYYMVASDGGIFAFGDAAFAGSMGGKPLNKPVQSLVPDADGKGYWLVASDGGIFAFDAPFRGSMGGTKLNKPVVGMVRYGDGYLMVGADGGIFNFSTSPFAGSLGDKPPTSPVVAVAALPAP